MSTASVSAPARAAGAGRRAGPGPRARLLDLLGIGFFGVGAVGIALPVLPTTIFWILAVVLWARSAPHRVEWVFGHPRFGPPVRRFVEEGTLSRRGKLFAVLGMGGGLGVALASLGPSGWLLYVLAPALVVSALWVVTRPEPAGRDGGEVPGDRTAPAAGPSGSPGPPRPDPGG